MCYLDSHSEKLKGKLQEELLSIYTNEDVLISWGKFKVVTKYGAGEWLLSSFKKQYMPHATNIYINTCIGLYRISKILTRI